VKKNSFELLKAKQGSCEHIKSFGMSYSYCWIVIEVICQLGMYFLPKITSMRRIVVKRSTEMKRVSRSRGIGNKKIIKRQRHEKLGENQLQ
jgi:hypothetical protein